MKDAEFSSDSQPETVKEPFLTPLEARKRITLSPLEVLMIVSSYTGTTDASN